MVDVQPGLDPIVRREGGAKVLINGAGHHIVFGMDWVPMLGGNPRRLALGRARTLGASHYVLAGNQAVSLGFGRMARKRIRGGQRLYSAAAIFAGHNPEGAAGFLVSIEPHGCWIVATHAGTVLSGTDRWFANTEEAGQALEAVRIRFPAIRIDSDPLTSGNVLPDWALGNPAASARLHQVESSVLGLPARGALLVGAAISAGIGWHFHGSGTGPSDRVPDAAGQWRDVLAAASRDHPIDSAAGLMDVIGHWRHLPVNPSGWSLRHVHCESGPGQWQCAAHYARLHRLALNAHLENFRPADWTLDFTPLNDATFSWRVERISTGLDWYAPRERHDWMSQLQRINPAFEHIQIGSGSAIALKSPTDAQGIPLARPTGVTDWAMRTLVLKGPLRSVPAIGEISAPVRWRRASLDVGRAVPAAIARSVLSVHLVGDLYEPRR